MSYQPFPASGSSAAPPSSAAPAKKGKGLLLAGVAVLVLGIAGAVLAFVMQNGQHEDSVKNLARAVPGFDNTLQFDKAGTFNLYYEYEGTVTTNVSGKPKSIQLSGPTEPPPMEATLTDKAGKKITLSDAGNAAKYDVAGYKGVAFKTAEIKAPGEFTLSIVPKNAKDTTFDLAVGKTAIEDPSLLLPILLGAIGLLLGGFLIIAGSRKPKVATVPVAGGLTFAPGAPTFGGYQQPGYQQPTTSYGTQPGGYQQPGGYPPATPTYEQPTYQQPGGYPPATPTYEQPTYQHPAQPNYGSQPGYQQPQQPYEQPAPPYGQQPTQPYPYQNPAPQDPNQQPPAPPNTGGWGAPPAPPAG